MEEVAVITSNTEPDPQSQAIDLPPLDKACVCCPLDRTLLSTLTCNAYFGHVQEAWRAAASATLQIALAVVRLAYNTICSFCVKWKVILALTEYMSSSIDEHLY